MILGVWMENVILGQAGSRDERMLILLRTLINLLLHEAHMQHDYRLLFPFLIKRINVHVKRLLQETDAVLIGQMVFVDAAALNS